MKKRLESQIYLQCPLIFRNKNAGLQVNLMQFGFDCGEGWFEILENLFLNIEAYSRHLLEQGRSIDKLPSAAQVKEKWGTLCVYIDNTDEHIETLIQTASGRSCVTCEICGNAGKIIIESYYRVRCESCLNL